jgi:hypothetical protein
LQSSQSFSFAVPVVAWKARTKEHAALAVDREKARRKDLMGERFEDRE